MVSAIESLGAKAVAASGAAAVNASAASVYAAGAAIVTMKNLLQKFVNVSESFAKNYAGIV